MKTGSSPTPSQPLPRYDDPPELRTAHDVRRLAACAYCKGSGDVRHMVPMQRKHEFSHGRCYVAVHGIGGLLHQPKHVTDTLTLGDIGKDAMKALMDKPR